MILYRFYYNNAKKRLLVYPMRINGTLYCQEGRTFADEFQNIVLTFKIKRQ